MKEPVAEKVTYVDRDGKRYDAWITGPINQVFKPRLKRTGPGDDGVEVVEKGETKLKIGMQSIAGATESENRVRPYVNLTVNFGDDAHPRFGDITGVRQRQHLDVNFKKAYYIPATAAVEASPAAPAPSTADLQAAIDRIDELQELLAAERAKNAAAAAVTPPKADAPKAEGKKADDKKK